MSEFPDADRTSDRLPYPASVAVSTANEEEGPAGLESMGGDPDGPDGATADPGDARRPGAAVLGMIRELVLVLVIALALSLLIKTFLLQAFFIPSPSMESTLLTGDRVLVSKLTPGPLELKRGDIVVFKDPAHWLPPDPPTDEGVLRDGVRSGLTFVGLLPASSDEHLIKRVIGLPGDKVVCCGTDGKLTVNGVEITEPYIFAGDVPSEQPFSITVPAGRIWVMGDHRSVSEDSRAHLQWPGHGMVPIDDVVGVAFTRLWPADRMGLLRNPSSTFSTVPAAS